MQFAGRLTGAWIIQAKVGEEVGKLNETAGKGCVHVVSLDMSDGASFFVFCDFLFSPDRHYKITMFVRRHASPSPSILRHTERDPRCEMACELLSWSRIMHHEVSRIVLQKFDLQNGLALLARSLLHAGTAALIFVAFLPV